MSGTRPGCRHRDLGRRQRPLVRDRRIRGASLVELPPVELVPPEGYRYRLRHDGVEEDLQELTVVVTWEGHHGHRRQERLSVLVSARDARLPLLATAASGAGLSAVEDPAPTRPPAWTGDGEAP